MNDPKEMEEFYGKEKATNDLFTAVTIGDVNACAQALSQGADITVCDSLGLQPLILACLAFSPELVDLLLQTGGRPCDASGVLRLKKSGFSAAVPCRSESDEKEAINDECWDRLLNAPEYQSVLQHLSDEIKIQVVYGEFGSFDSWDVF